MRKYILPTWLVFRFAPGYPRHTLPEGFFLQVFLSVQWLLLGFIGYWNTTVETVIVIIYMWTVLCSRAVDFMPQSGRFYAPSTSSGA